jgi:hypothetical protein
VYCYFDVCVHERDGSSLCIRKLYSEK